MAFPGYPPVPAHQTIEARQGEGGGPLHQARGTSPTEQPPPHSKHSLCWKNMEYLERKGAQQKKSTYIESEYGGKLEKNGKLNAMHFPDTCNFS